MNMDTDVSKAKSDRLELMKKNNNFGLTIEGVLAKMHLVPVNQSRVKEPVDTAKVIIPL